MPRTKKSFRCHRTLVVSTRSLMLSRAWLILKTIQSNSALYSDFAIESRTVLAWRTTHTIPFQCVLYNLAMQLWGFFFFFYSTKKMKDGLWRHKTDYIKVRVSNTGLTMKEVLRMQTVPFLLYKPLLKCYCNQNPCWKKYKLGYPKVIPSTKSLTTEINITDLLACPWASIDAISQPNTHQVDSSSKTNVRQRRHHLPSSDAKTSECPHKNPGSRISYTETLEALYIKWCVKHDIDWKRLHHWTHGVPTLIKTKIIWQKFPC